MFSPKKNSLFFTTVLILNAVFLSTCSETSEYGDASDYEKLGAADTISPIVSSLSPTDNSSDVAVATTIAVTFNEEISTGTVTTNTSDTTCSGTFQLSSDNFSSCVKMSAVPTVSNDDKTFTLTPTESLSTRTTYRVKLTTSVTDANGVALDSYTTNGFTTYYDRFTSGSGVISGTTIKQSDSSALEDVSVQYNIGGYTKTVTSDSSGDYGIYALTEGDYTLSYSLSGYQGSTQSASLVSDTDNITVATLSMLSTSCSSGDISGTIKDAVSGDNVSGVAVSIRSGLNVRTGSTVSGKTATTDSNGAYTLSDVDAGNYTAEASKSGFITSYFNTSACGDVNDQDTNMSETLPDGAMRIVLTWYGIEDFDSHLEIPVTDAQDGLSGNTDGTHLWYNTGQSATTYNGVTTTAYHRYGAGDNVTLDQDNQVGIVSSCPISKAGSTVSECGPETVTISKVLSSGSYRFHVYAFDQAAKNTSNAGSTHLADNGTYVQVFYNDTSYNFDVPKRAGNLWTVFDFDNSTGFTQLNYMNYESTSGNIDNY